MTIRINAETNIHMSSRYGSNAFNWPVNDETCEYFEADRAFWGTYSEAAKKVLGINKSSANAFDHYER